MGANHTTLSATVDDVSTLLPEYNVEERLYPGSGRMMRTFRLSHKETSSLVVAKVMWTTAADDTLLQQQKLELERIQEALRQTKDTHVAPFVFWKLGNPTATMNRAVGLVRNHTYTTLSDRLESRPFLTNIEKLYIIHQFLSALQFMHDQQVLHGFLTTENIGLTSWNHVVILDIASYKAHAALPDDDPSDYLYYYQQEAQQHDNSSQREKRCYLAPERFYSPKTTTTYPQPPDNSSITLTKAMDVFSAGCIILETWLNGERALDLGDLMDYRKEETVPPSLQQKFSKIESSNLRAACRHMMTYDPTQRLTPQAYLERLHMPSVFNETFEPLLERVKDQAPDARIAVAAAVYPDILKATVGVTDDVGKEYFVKLLGPTVCRLEKLEYELDGKENVYLQQDIKRLDSNNLLEETEALLKRLANLDLNESIGSQVNSPGHNPSVTTPQIDTPADLNETAPSPESLLIFVQLILANLRHVNRPSSKLVALQLLSRLSQHSSDETRLQRMIPSAIVLLQDQDPLVRAMALHTMTTALSQVQSFPPSDSKLFPQYIFKRVAPLLTDPSIVVRVAFSHCISVLAETSRRFLDITHSVRLYEAVGGAISSVDKPKVSRDPSVFDEDVVRLLDGPAVKDEEEEMKEGNTHLSRMTRIDNTLIANTYDAELSGLQEVVSRWVLHITTSEQSSAPKRALLKDLARLCNFFGRDGVMAFILPQILAFLNDRRDWQLRAALFDDIPAACFLIGRAATEHFVLPCLETALFDSEDQVLRSALVCLATLVDMGLLSRSVLVNTYSRGLNERSDKRGALFEKYCPLLLFPTNDVRRGAIMFVNSCCKAFGSPDAEVFLVPRLQPYLRFEPSMQHLTTEEGLEKCLIVPWTKARLSDELSQSVRTGQSSGITTAIEKPSLARLQSESDEQVKEFIKLLAKSRANKSPGDSSLTLSSAIEGSLKLSQNVKFPTQSTASSVASPIPSWFTHARTISKDTSAASEFSSLQSVAALNQVYGLSIMRGSDETPIVPRETSSSEEFDITNEDLAARMMADSAKLVDAAFAGEWGSECMLDASLDTTTSLVGKLKGIGVPTLSPRLGIVVETELSKESLAKGMGDWRPKIETLIASSSPVNGHTGPVCRLAVSQDQRFFVSGSFDSTCRVWELGKVASSCGIMESSATYDGHKDTDSARPSRVNDIVILEGSHSVASASSDGRVDVWKVDLVTSSLGPPASAVPSGMGTAHEYSRVSGSSLVRTIDASQEGEILAVCHFNTLSESMLTFATQRGTIHSWDLRSEQEPFQLKQPAEMGYLTSMALGSDRNWMVHGTSKGYIALWDIRFQRMVKLWQHSGGQPINRLATSFAPIPGSRSNAGPRPLIFVASGSECGMFDLLDGECRQGFRMLTPQVGYGATKARIDMAVLKEIDVTHKNLNSHLRKTGAHWQEKPSSTGPTMNAMVGSMGGNDQNYLITGGGDAYIRYWDFSYPSKCYTVSGQIGSQHRSNYERVDFQSNRLLICRQTSGLPLHDIESSRLPRRLHRGLTRVESRHQDAILDLKLIQTPIKAIVSCSRDGTVKLFK